MKRIMLVLGLFGMFSVASNAWASHRTALNRDNLTYGTLRAISNGVEYTSFTMMGNLEPSLRSLAISTSASNLFISTAAPMIDGISLSTRAFSLFRSTAEPTIDGFSLFRTTTTQMIDGTSLSTQAFSIFRSTAEYEIARWRLFASTISNGTAQLNVGSVTATAFTTSNTVVASALRADHSIHFNNFGGSITFPVSGAPTSLRLQVRSGISGGLMWLGQDFDASGGVGISANSASDFYINKFTSGKLHIYGAELDTYSSATFRGLVTSSSGFVGDGSRLTNLPGGGGGGDPTVITTFTKIFSIAGDMSISTFTFDPLGTAWDIGNGTITIIGVSFKAQSSSVTSTSVGIMLATGGATSVYSSIYPSSFTIGTNANYNFIASSWVAPTTTIIYPGSRLSIHVSNAPLSGQAPRDGKVMMEYFTWKKQ